MDASFDQTRDTVILCGPAMDLAASTYGGGAGGYVRNVSLLLEHFSQGDVRMTLSPYSTRRFTRWWWLVLPARLVRDLWVFARNIRGGGAVHLMMTYGVAIYREFGMSVIARAYGRPLILDIRGGAFLSWLESAGWLHRTMAHYVMRNANVILGQGATMVDSLRRTYGDKVHHFPNFVRPRDLPATVRPRCTDEELAVIFVGYCYEGKGVFELVDGCARATRSGVRIHLTLVGAESAEFKEYLDARTPVGGLTIDRQGALGFDAVQSLLARSDIFCFPTRHGGEGHPNAINEAMAQGLVIVTTKHGFIPELLDESSAYFVEPGSRVHVAETLAHIHTHRDEARAKADNARVTLRERYTESIVLGRLREDYRRVLRPT